VKKPFYNLAYIAVFTLCSCAGGNPEVGGPFDCTRWILEDDVTNARDLGAWPLEDDYFIPCQKIFRGGDLTTLSTEACTDFTNLGIKTVIDLRADSVQLGQPGAACVTSITGQLNAAMPKLLPDTPENYLALLEETGAIATIFEALGNPDTYPVYIHCVIGRDRASFVIALILLTLGADQQTILNDFNLSEDAGVAVKPDSLQAVLDEIDKLGGIEVLLASASVTSGQIEVLKTEARTK